MAKGLKLKVRNFWGLIPAFVEVTGEKLVGLGDFLPLSPILNKVKPINVQDSLERKLTSVFIIMEATIGGVL